MLVGLGFFIKANPSDSIPKIQIALLLDVSGSMNGLINQAQTQIWKIVNIISSLEKTEKKPLLEMAVVSYGNAMFAENDHIRIESFFEKEIDQVAEKLSMLNVGGGNEYCGRALQIALDSLQWSGNQEDLKMIFIAGNEGFDQGSMNYINVADGILKKNIFLNTIYCGHKNQGIEELWDDAAFHGGGEYATIDQEMKMENMETPYDTKIINMYQMYRTTLLYYGKEGFEKKERLQKYDDQNQSNRNIFFRDRIIYKVIYEWKDSRFDLLQLFEEHPNAVNEIREENLPPELHSKTPPRTKKDFNSKPTKTTGS